jgi:hypothetical protein
VTCSGEEAPNSRRVQVDYMLGRQSEGDVLGLGEVRGEDLQPAWTHYLSVQNEMFEEGGVGTEDAAEGFALEVEW